MNGEVPASREHIGLRGPRVLLLLAIAVYVCSAFWHVWTGGMNADEGFYAIAARAAWSGELPYRDFGYTQTPLLPYLNGAMMQVTGFGLFQQRLVNGLWGAAALAVGAIWLARRCGILWAAGFVLLFGLSAPWMYFAHLGKTYASAALAVTAAAWIWLEIPPGPRKILALALAGTIGVGIRLPTAPYFAVLWLGALTESAPGAWRRTAAAAAASFVWPAILILPFWAAAPEASLFWMLDFHQLSVPSRDWHVRWQDVLALAPVPWLAAIGGLAWRLFTRRAALRTGWLAAAVFLGLAANVTPAGAFEEYAIPFLPPLALVAALLWWPALQAAGRRPVAVAPLAAIAVNLAAAPLLLWTDIATARVGRLGMWLPLNAPDYQPNLRARIFAARDTVRYLLPADAPFIGPQIILAAETGHAVPRKLRLGPFTATADFEPERADRLGLITFPELDALFAQPDVVLLAFSKNANLNYGWSMPSYRNPPERDGARWSALFRRQFEIAYDDTDFLILRRRSPAEAH